MVAPARPIPQSLADITPEWLTGVLQDSSDLGPAQTVASVSATEISAGIGFIGVVARLALTYSGTAVEAPASVVAKLPSPDPGSRMIGIAFGLYEREARFYGDIASDCGMSTPEAFFCGYDSATGGVCILLEDLTDGAFGDQVRGATLAEAERALDALANLHARWWRSPEFPRHEWLKDGLANFKQPIALMYESSWRPAFDRFGHLFPQELKDLAPTLLPRALKAMDLLAAAPETLTHGDYRQDNLFYASDSAHPLVVCDWQGPARSPAVLDLAYYLAGSLPIEIRRAHEQDLLRRYHAGLEEGGVRDYPFDRLFQDYRQYFAGIPAAGGAVLLAALPDGNERGRLMLETTVSRFLAASEDLDALSLLPEA